MKKNISIISKIICFTLVLWMLLEPCSVAYADTYPSYDKGVTGRRIVKDNNKSVYSVDVTWGKMQFIYKTVGTRKWNDKTHLFDEDLTSSWVASGNTIKVTNHSNVDVKAKFTYNKSAKYSKVVGKFSGASEMELPSAVGRKVDDEELTSTKKLTLSGSLANTLNDYTSIGNIKIEIN